MPRLAIDYSNAVIYKLSCKNKSITEIYIGSTTNFTKRKYQHKHSCINTNNPSYIFQKYKFIRENGGWENWEMIEIEKFPCKTSRELSKREEELRCQFKAKLNSYACWTNGPIRCKIDGCENQCKKDGVCIKHGAVMTRCKIDGCENQWKIYGVCVKHGEVVPRCKMEGCKNYRVEGDACRKHGGIKPLCKIQDCKNRRVKGWVCIEHGAVIPLCKIDGCENQ